MAAGTPAPGTVLPSTHPTGQSPIFTPDSPLLKRPGLVTLLAVLQFIAGGGALLLVVIMAFVTAKEPVSGAIASGVIALFAILHIVCGIGLLKLRPWGRVLQIILAFIGLLALPLGTIIAILILVYMFRPNIVLLFSGRKPEEFTSAEIQVLRTQGGGNNGAAVAIALVAGLFVFIAFAGIIAAIAVPNLLSAVQRGKQKRTIADMKAVAVVVEAYGVDNNAYPDAGTIDELAAILEPAYVQHLPRTDGWGRPFKYEAWLENEDDEVPTTFVIGSAGKDGAWERDDLIDTPEGRTTHFDADIVLVNSAFVQIPEGIDSGRLKEQRETPPEKPPTPEPEAPVLRSGVPPRVPIPT